VFAPMPEMMPPGTCRMHFAVCEVSGLDVRSIGGFARKVNALYDLHV
jgi:hypothetical protein